MKRLRNPIFTNSNTTLVKVNQELSKRRNNGLWIQIQLLLRLIQLFGK